MKKLALLVILLATAQLLAPPKAAAQELVAVYKHWSLWCDTKPCKVCTITTSPQGGQQNFLLVYVAPNKGGEVSAVFHKNYKIHSHPDLIIDAKQFELFSKENRAWAIDTTTDKQIIGAMVKGLTAVLSGVAQSGEPIREKFSLVGFSSAWQRANKTCGK